MFEWILHTIETGGYAGVFFLMILENLFPPIPSEVVIPLTGFAAAEGQFNFLLVVFVATCGTVVGALPWYFLGRCFGLRRLKALSARYGRLLTLSPDDIDRADVWFQCHGQKVVLFGRLMPTVRSLISIPAGLARMPFGTFIAYSFIGSGLWTLLLASLGYMLESHYDRVEQYLNPVSNFIIIAMIVGYIYRVVTFNPSIKNGGQ